MLTLGLRLYKDTLTPSTDISNVTFFFFIPLDLNSYYFEMNHRKEPIKFHFLTRPEWWIKPNYFNKIRNIRKLALIRRMAATISIRLLGRGTSRLPMYCKKSSTINPQGKSREKRDQPIRPSIYNIQQLEVDRGSLFPQRLFRVISDQRWGETTERQSHVTHNKGLRRNRKFKCTTHWLHS
jgi:hypothetical protein